MAPLALATNSLKGLTVQAGFVAYDALSNTPT